MRSETLLKNTVDVTSIIKELFREVVGELFKAVNTNPPGSWTWLQESLEAPLITQTFLNVI